MTKPAFEIPELTPAKITAAASVVVAGLAFWLSFTALSDLAVRFGVPEFQAFAFPLVVDGLVIVATVAAATLKTSRWYAWALLLVGSAVSVAGNAVHAHTVSGNPIAVGIAVVPPVFLLAVTHLTIMLARQEWAATEPATIVTAPSTDESTTSESETAPADTVLAAA